MRISKYLSNIEDFNGKKIIIAGGTAGIGLSLINQLLMKGATIVLLARNLSKAESVKKDLLIKYPEAKIDIIQYDQSDYDLIDSAVLAIKEKHSDFYAFVANAGILCPKDKKLSKQGNPLTIETNFLGLYRFLEQMVPLFNNKRYVMQGSVAASLIGNKKVDIYNNKYKLFKQYNISKACVESLWHYYYLNNKDNEFILTEPGVVSTDLFNNFNWFLRVVGGFAVKVSSHSVEKASLTLLKGLTKDAHNGTYIVPRGTMTIFGYPKIKKFPKRRIREYLIKQVKS